MAELREDARAVPLLPRDLTFGDFKNLPIADLGDFPPDFLVGLLKLGLMVREFRCSNM